MAGLFVRLNLAILSLATALHAFDERLFGARLQSTVQPDVLVHYNMLLAWWRHGDSPRGFTLTPSPYFIDMLVELPIMLLAPDFEQFSYALACAYALLIFGSLYLVLRIALESGPALALLATALTIVSFYKLAPFNVIVHVFVVNHTSELFTTLGLLALLHAWFRPGARRRPYAPYLYIVAVAGCVTSSPFFIATYCVPAAIAALAILGTESMSRRRLAWFWGLTALGAVVGLIAIAIISRYAWPVRNDSYRGWWKSYRMFRHTLIMEPGGIRIFWAMVVAMTASMALVIVGRRTRRWSNATTFLLAFFPVCVVAAIGIPIKRGAFDGAYAFRYVTLPWLLLIAFYVTAGARFARAGLTALLTPPPRRRRRLVAWTSAVLGALGIALVTTFHGSLTIYDEASWTSPMIRCVRDAEFRGDIRDGLATWTFARYMNAARHASDWSSPYVIVQILAPGDERPTLDPRDNDLLWFNGAYREGRGRLNFVATHSLSESQLQYFRDQIGVPDRTISCPAPRNFLSNRKPTFELWVWDGADAQQKLTDLVTHDNLRSPFSPVIGATRMRIDPVWGMSGDPRLSDLVGGHRVWRPTPTVHNERFAWLNTMWLSGGRYRLELELATVPMAGSAQPVAYVDLWQERKGDIARFPIVGGGSPTVFEFEITNRGGATSGDAVVFSMVPGAAASIEISGATLTLLEQRGISPFQIFR